MLLPKPEPDVPRIRLSDRQPDIPRGVVRAAKVDANVRFLAFQAIHVAPVCDAVPHGAEQPFEVRSPEIGPAVQGRQRVELRAHAVEVDVCGRVDVQALGEVRVYAQELGTGAGASGCVHGLGFEGGKEGLEPFERAGVFADPDELHSSETAWRIRAGAEMPYVLEDAGPRGNTNACANKNGDLIVEDILGRSTVRAVDPDRGHFLAIL